MRADDQAKSSPLELYLKWLESLPPEVAKEFASVLTQLFPGQLFRQALLAESPLDGLVSRVRTACGREPHQLVGFVSSLAALTDLTFLERANPSWTARTDAFLGLLENAEAGAQDLLGDEVSTWVMEQRLRQPFRTRQWARERPRWEALRRQALSPDALLRWLRLGAR